MHYLNFSFFGSISWKGFSKTFANFDIKKPFGLSFCPFVCLINWNSFGAFALPGVNQIFSLSFILSLHFVCQMMHWIIKHALQNFGCKSKTKYTDYLPRTKAYLFSKKIKEIWNQRLFFCWGNDRKRVRKNKTQNPRLVTCSTNVGCQTTGPRTPKVQILSPLNFSISVATGKF